MVYDRSMTTAQSYRRMVNAGNKIVVGLQRLGVAFGPMQLLTVPGRRTGVPRTFPIAVLPIDGHRYIVQAYPKAAWVANVRAAGEVTLTRVAGRPRRGWPSCRSRSGVPSCASWSRRARRAWASGS